MKFRDYFSRLTPSHIGIGASLVLLLAALLAILIGVSANTWAVGIVLFFFIAFAMATAGISLGWLATAIRRTLLATRRNEKLGDRIFDAAKTGNEKAEKTLAEISATRSTVNKVVSMQVGPPPIKKLALTATTESPRGMEPASKEILTEAGFKRNERFITVVEKRVIDAKSENNTITLGSAGFHDSLQIGAQERVTLSISLIAAHENRSAKAGIIWVRALDQDGFQIQVPILPTEHPELGSYKYLSSHKNEILKFELDVPAGAKIIEYGLKNWDGTVCLHNLVEISVERPNPVWLSSRRKKDIQVAVILDEFSFNSFKPEFQPVILHPDNWKKQFEKNRPDLFLCESAWSGTDSEQRPWKGKVYTSSEFRQENRQELLAILDYCKQHGIPTVFWNKEDPAHFDDKKHNFVDTAIRFDHIFTTDDKCVSRYKLEYGHKSVDVLPFAVQPLLFNPIETSSRSRDVIFAGGWYENHHQRSADMRSMFDAVLKGGRELKIYNRFSESDDPMHQYPEEYNRYTTPSIPHSRMPSVYKESEIGMTINTETRSNTMFARRVFELMACNTLVVSNYSQGVENFFGKNVIFLDRNPDALQNISQPDIKAIREENLTTVLKGHTYEKRFEKILQVCGIESRELEMPYSICVLVETIEEAAKAWTTLRSRYSRYNRKTILVSPGVDPLKASAIVRDFNHSGIVVGVSDLVLSAETDPTELFNFCDGVILLADLESTPSYTDLERLELHSSYVDFPVVLGDPQEAYSFKLVNFSGITICKPEHFRSLLNKIVEDPFIAYSI